MMGPTYPKVAGHVGPREPKVSQAELAVGCFLRCLFEVLKWKTLIPSSKSNSSQVSR